MLSFLLCENADAPPLIRREACPGDSSLLFPGRIRGSSCGRNSGIWSRKAWRLHGVCWLGSGPRCPRSWVASSRPLWRGRARYMPERHSLSRPGGGAGVGLGPLE